MSVLKPKLTAQRPIEDRKTLSVKYLKVPPVALLFQSLEAGLGSLITVPVFVAVG